MVYEVSYNKKIVVDILNMKTNFVVIFRNIIEKLQIAFLLKVGICYLLVFIIIF